MVELPIITAGGHSGRFDANFGAAAAAGCRTRVFGFA